MKENLVLIGMPGSGKTSVGKILAERLGFVFADLDEEIAKAAGKSIPKIFAAEGEEGFRQRETACAREAASRTGQVIATGGGIILRKENMEALSASGTVIFLDRTVEEICGSDLSGRPLIAGDLSRVQALYDQRIGLYRQYAEVTAGSHAAPAEVAESIIALLKGDFHG